MGGIVFHSLFVLFPDTKIVITSVLLSFMLHGSQFTAAEDTDQTDIMPEPSRSPHLSPKVKQTDIVHAGGYQKDVLPHRTTARINDIHRLLVSQNKQPISTRLFLSARTHFQTFPSYSRSSDIPEWSSATTKNQTPLYYTKIVPVSQSYSPSSFQTSPGIIPSVRLKSPEPPTMPPMPSMHTASLTPSPTRPTMVTPPTPGCCDQQSSDWLLISRQAYTEEGIQKD